MSADAQTSAALGTLETLGVSDGIEFAVDGRLCEPFEFSLDAGALLVLPRRPAPQRRTLRPLAFVEVQTSAGLYPELMLSMGRIDFEPGQSDEHRYRPFTRDDQRTIRTVLVGLERPLVEDAAFLNAVFRRFVTAALAESWPERAELGMPSDVPAWAARFELLNWHAHGWMSLAELHLLDWATRVSAAGDRHVIEIGSYQGRSTAAIAAALGDRGVQSLVLSIDPNELAAQQAEVARANVAAVGQTARLVQVQRTSRSVKNVFADRIACMAFIDGSHEPADVLADFRLCDRLLAPGGVLAFHDVYPIRHLGYTPARTGPAELIEQIVLPSGRYRPLAAAHLLLALQKTD
ncbi:MAG: class I SAM-dependent methyltransferase [Phycisphaerae bacterium]|jgi:predicted O-methyltransferase YrrM